MITEIITFRVRPEDFDLIEHMAEKAELGGRSNVRLKDERTMMLTEDQILGQLGKYALSYYMTGSDRCYRSQRVKVNQTPYIGTKGMDLFRLNANVKTSLMRKSKDPMTYHLLVRPDERHPGLVYIMGLVEGRLEDRDVEVHFMGWTREEDLPEEPSKDGRFSGAFAVPAPMLNQLPPFFWNTR